MIIKYQTLTSASRALFGKGYRNSLIFKNESIVNPDTMQAYSSDQLVIDEFHHFLPDSIESEARVIFALSYKGRPCGTFIPLRPLFVDKAVVRFLNSMRVSSKTKKPAPPTSQTTQRHRSNKS